MKNNAETTFTAIATSTALLGMLAAGCTSHAAANDAPKPKAVATPTMTQPPQPVKIGNTCRPIHLDQWGQVPATFNYQRMAQKLHLDPDDLTSARLGGAVCDKAVNIHDIEVFGPVTIADVQGFAGHCVIVGLLVEPKTRPAKEYHDLLLVCPETTTA